MSRTVIIDCFPEQISSYGPEFAVVAIDVIRATTTALTAVASGRRCLPAPTLEAVAEIAAGLEDPVLAGELGGHTPFGFDLDNSPSEVASRSDVHRPLVLLSTSGTRLITGGTDDQTVYVACLRNYLSQIAYLVSRHEHVVVIGAGSRGEFREEDALCCAWIAEGLVRAGYHPEGELTAPTIDRWQGARVDAIASGKSAAFLRNTGKDRDLAFVLDHVNDVHGVLVYQRGELVLIPGAP